MDIEKWLRGLGLQQYVTAFRENNVEAEVLLQLTADDLKDIGVSSVGHRRKLLEAIAELRKISCPTSVIQIFSTATRLSFNPFQRRQCNKVERAFPNQPPRQASANRATGVAQPYSWLG
jgi:hypothetical protein